MERKGNTCPVRFNQFQESPSIIRRHNFYCIYNDVDEYDSFLGSWVLDVTLSKHITKTFVSATEHTDHRRLPSGYLFLVGICFNKEHMIELINTSVKTVVITNNVFDRMLLMALGEMYPETKLSIIYDAEKTNRDLSADCFKRIKTPEVIKTFNALTKKERQYFLNALNNTTCNFSLLYRIEKDVGVEFPNIIKLGKSIDDLVDQTWDELFSTLDEKVGYLSTCGMEIPIITVNKPHVRRGIAKHLLNHLGSSVVGITYSMGTNVGVYLHSASSDVSAGFIANTFGGSGTMSEGSFTLDSLQLNDLY